MFKLKITPRAKFQLKQISKLYQQRAVEEALLDIREDPSVGKALTLELTDLFSYKLGSYRIIYKVDKQNKIIVVFRAGHRSGVYG